MTENQIKSVTRKFNDLNNYLIMVKNDPHVRNKDMVEEIQLNIESEIERLISFEGDETIEKYTEILKLKDMLEKAGIPFDFDDYEGGYHIAYPEEGDNRICSVIEHDFSYGHADDLLEILGLLTEDEASEDEVAGWLTADDVFSRIKADFDKGAK